MLIQYADEQHVVNVFIDHIRSITDAVGGDSSYLHRIAGLFGADWLPSDALTTNHLEQEQAHQARQRAYHCRWSVESG